MKLYHTESVYMIKLPQYAEKISLGCYMEQSRFKIYDKKSFSPVSVQNLSSYGLSTYEEDHMMEIKDHSSCPSRFFTLSGMKPYIASIVPNGYSQLEAIIEKRDCSLSVNCGGLNQVLVKFNVHADKEDRKQGWGY